MYKENVIESVKNFFREQRSSIRCSKTTSTGHYLSTNAVKKNYGQRSEESLIQWRITGFLCF
jgi:hypothetical protein